MNVAFSLILADPVLHQIPVLYKGSENSWGDGDTGIDLDMHPAIGDNFGDFLRVRGFPLGGGRSECEIESSSEGLLLPPPPFGLGDLIGSPDSNKSQLGVNNRDADGTGFGHGSLVFASGQFRGSPGGTVILFLTGISDVWRFFIIATAKILDIFCSMQPGVSGRRSLLFW